LHHRNLYNISYAAGKEGLLVANYADETGWFCYAREEGNK